MNGRSSKSILEHFEPRIEDAEGFAIHARVILVEDSRGTPLNISLGALPYEENVIARATPWQAPSSGSLITCGVEDLIVLKAFANRPQDFRDIEGVIIRQGSSLDRELILKELTPLVELKEEPEILDQLQLLFHKHSVEPVVTDQAAPANPTARRPSFTLPIRNEPLPYPAY